MPRRGPLSDLAQLHTPPCERGSLWWMREHVWAEQAVTLAAKALDAATSERERRLWSDLLDARLDHLERTEDRCDAILDALRAREPAWVAVAAKAYYIDGKPLAESVQGLPVGQANVSDVVSQAIRRLDRTE